MKHYWSKHETEQLRLYQQSTDMVVRNHIFETTLLPALSKLIECMLAKSSITTTLDKRQLNDDCLTHCVGYLDRIDCNNNPFAYLTLATKHFIFQSCSKQHKLSNRDVSLDVINKDGDDCEDLLQSRIEIPIDNSPVVGEDVDELLKKTLDYWTEDKIHQTIKSTPFNSSTRNRMKSSIMYYLYRLGSPHITFDKLKKTFKSHNKFSLQVANKFLTYLSKESKRVLLD